MPIPTLLIIGQMRRWSRTAAFVGIIAAATTTGACKDFLTADNPASLPVDRLADAELIDLMHNSTIAGLGGPNHFWYTYLVATYTDELRNLASNVEETLYDRRQVFPENSYNSVFTYGPIQRARWLADSLASRVRALEGDSALRDVRLARMYAIAGYQLIRLAEGWCEVPISTGDAIYSAPIPSAGLFQLAEARFDAALNIAIASRAANAPLTTTLGQRYTAAADSITNLAYLGMARAALGRNDKTKAAAKARLVTGIGTTNAWEWRIAYNAGTSLGLSNTWGERMAGGAGATVVAISNTPFFALDDARVPHPINSTTGAPLPEVATNGSFVVPNSPPTFSTFNGTKVGADPTADASMRLGSLLEAQYIIAEAEGATASNIAFVESRRLAFPSNTATTVTTATNYMANLMEQRGRDLYLGGHRLGDLRRWDKYYGISNRWPTGSFYGSTTVTFGTGKCWPMNAAEITNNPLVPKPYTPPTGP
ncbi:MAG: hypothetical protein ABIV11_07160 [Gemmatimonadaceae bacterium]